MPAPIFEKKNILVTGGAGFVGSHLCERLLQDARVICMDNFVTSSERNIDALLQNPDFEFIHHDVNAPFDLASFPELARFKLKFQGVQEIYHMAAPTSPKKFNQYRMQSLLTMGIGTKNVMDVAVQHQAKVLLSSSSVIYGPRPEDNHRIKEEEWGTGNTLSPRACYDEGKRFAETTVSTYAQVHNLDVKIARIFRIYGPRMALFDGHMVPDFILNALEGKPLQIFGDERFRSSLLYVADLVDGLIKLMHAPATVGPVNFGSDMDMPIADVANKVLQLTQSQSKVTYQPPLEFMTPLGLPDISKARESLGWLPLVSLEDGLKKTIDYTVANKHLLTMEGKE